MIKSPQHIGFVITGDELINGDILNTNGQYICQQLLQHSMTPGQQVVVSDNEHDIQQAIHYLQQQHAAIITIGGLGPTLDDKTRYGLASALQLPLHFYDTVWQDIVTRITSLGYQEIPESNRQQASLPEGATVLKNLNGTAAGCYIHHNGHDYFMLPGPPNECRPMFDSAVIEKLQACNYSNKTYRKSWLLLGASEGEIANRLEPFLQGITDCQLGYRVSYPYLEIKLVSKNADSLQNLAQPIHKLLAPLLVSENRETTSEQLRHYIANKKYNLHIKDHATQGALFQQLITPKTYAYLHHPNAKTTIEVSGLEDYWQARNKPSYPVTLSINTQKILLNIPARGPRTLTIAIEKICWEIIKVLRSKESSS